MAPLACASTPLAYRGQPLAVTGSAPGTPVPTIRPGAVFLLEATGASPWMGAFVLTEYPDLMVLEALVYARGPNPLLLSPDMAILRDFSGRILAPLHPGEAANRFMGPSVGRAPFHRGPFRFKPDYWVADVDYGYPQIPDDAAETDGGLREALSSTLAEQVARRRGSSPLAVVEGLYVEGLTPQTEVGARTTLRFNLTWRNEHPKTYPMELRIPAVGAAVRLGAR